MNEFLLKNVVKLEMWKDRSWWDTQLGKIQLIILPVFETEIFWIGGCRTTAGLAWNY